MKNLLWFALFISLITPASAYNVDRLMIPSAAMKKDIPVNVVMPKAYTDNTTDTFPVLYLLHGAGDNDWTWLNATTLPRLDTMSVGISTVVPKRIAPKTNMRLFATARFGFFSRRSSA